jgi:hypothetical protein
MHGCTVASASATRTCYPPTLIYPHPGPFFQISQQPLIRVSGILDGPQTCPEQRRTISALFPEGLFCLSSSQSTHITLSTQRADRDTTSIDHGNRILKHLGTSTHAHAYTDARTGATPAEAGDAQQRQRQ